MKTLPILSGAALAAAHMVIAGALAAPLPGSGTAAPAPTDLVRVQAGSPPQAPADRWARLRQHRAILESALQPRGREAPQPQSRALQPPGPMVVTAPAPPQPIGEGQGGLTCEAAARIVADFGFSDIGSQQCAGDLYRFSAMRDGTAYAIAINAATGEIAEVSRQ